MNKAKYPLTTQTKKVMLVIRKPSAIDTAKFQQWLNDNTTKYAWITHDKHVDPVTSEIIPIHYHAVFEYEKPKTPLLTILNSIVKFMGFDNANGVQIDKYDNEVKAIQYLIHRNNPEKTQETIDKVIHNWDSKEFEIVMTTDNDTAFTFDLAYTLCNRYDNVVELLRNIPPKMFKENYKYIAVIWNFIHHAENKL